MRLNNSWTSVLGLLLVLFVYGCTDLTKVDEVDVNLNGEYAIPLINTKARILDIADNTSSNAKVQVETDGKMTIFYTTDTVRRTARQIFAPVEISIPIFIVDSVAPVPLPVSNFPASWVLNRATLNDMGIKWNMVTSFDEDISVTITIPELSSNGEVYTDSWIIPASESTFDTGFNDLDGWDVSLTNNEMNVNYEALRPNGDRILLDELVFRFDRLDFNYIEGFFGREENPIEGNVITVGAFSKWLSGGLWFEDPKVNIEVKNAFGFPVRAEFSEVRFTTIEGNTWNLEGEFVTDGVDFDYPLLNEVGQVKENTFVFTIDNSNVQEGFNEKVAEVFFDINAIGNPDDDPSIIGFMTSESFYEVVTDVEMPLFLYANNLLLTDTIELEVEEFNDVSEAEFKLVMENDFPFDVDLQAYFQEDGVITDSLFSESYFLPASEADANGNLLSTGSATAIIPFNPERFDKVTAADNVIFLVKLVSLNNQQIPLWIYEDYDLDLRLGAKIRIGQ